MDEIAPEYDVIVLGTGEFAAPHRRLLCCAVLCCCSACLLGGVQELLARLIARGMDNDAAILRETVADAHVNHRSDRVYSLWVRSDST